MDSQDQYALLDLITDSILVIEPDYTISFANHYCRELYGAAGMDLIGMKCHQAIHHCPVPCTDKDLPPDEQCVHARVFATKQPATVIHHHTMADGSHRFFQVSTSPVWDSSGAIVRLISIIKDVTECREAEEALRESESLYRYLYNNLGDGACVIDLDGHMLDVNDIVLNRLGYTRDELLAISPEQILAPGFGGNVRSHIQEVMARKDVTIESAYRTKKGEIIPAEIRCNLIAYHGTPAILILARDISERKKAERELRESREQWENTFDAMSDIVTIQDKEMRIIRANRAAEDFFQVRRGGLAGRYCYDVFRGVTVPCGGCPLVETFRDGKKHSEIIRHENLDKVFQVSSAVTTDGEGNLECLVHVARDITEQKRLEEELFQAHKMEAIGTLAGGIAHDFNNILAAIVGYAELAREALPPASAAAADIGEVLQASRRASELIRQILSFSRKGTNHRYPLEPHLVVKEALKMLRSSLPATIEINEDIDPESGTVLADPTRIHQIIVNLCTNALHAMDEETGTLTVKMGLRELSAAEVKGYPGVHPGPFIELMVGDTGCGMDAVTRWRIFEPYFTTKEKDRGTGLGLAVVQGIVHEYGGMITVESEPGCGSTFHIFLPCVMEEAVPAERLEEQSLPTGSERILVVDDERAIAELQKASLTRRGYAVTALTSSREALATFSGDPGRFDLLVTDQTMPELSGAKLAGEVLRIRPELPVIICTGFSSTLTMEKARDMGIRKYLAKPVSGRDLARAVRDVLDGRGD